VQNETPVYVTSKLEEKSAIVHCTASKRERERESTNMERERENSTRKTKVHVHTQSHILIDTLHREVHGSTQPHLKNQEEKSNETTQGERSRERLRRERVCV
jgi:hypothetical protein